MCGNLDGFRHCFFVAENGQAFFLKIKLFLVTLLERRGGVAEWLKAASC